MISHQEESKVINWLVLIGVLIAFIIFFIPVSLWVSGNIMRNKYRIAISNFGMIKKGIENAK